MINISKKLIEKSKKNIVFIFFTYTNTDIAHFLILQNSTYSYCINTPVILKKYIFKNHNIGCKHNNTNAK